MQSIGAVLKRFNPLEDRYISREFQAFGVYLSEQLGDPKHGREAARAGNFDLFRAIFTAHMEVPASRDALNDAVSMAIEKRSVLVCFERDPKHCHRAIVAERMAALGSLTIANLGVQPRSAQGRRDYVGAADRFARAC